MVSVTVLIPSVPEREHYRREAMASVRWQTIFSDVYGDWLDNDAECIVRVDVDHEGCARTVNALAREVESEWLFILADDDLMLPRCLEAHLAASADVGIVYSPPLVWGADPSPYHGRPPAIPSASLIRTSLWRELGGYDESREREEDRDFYTRALAVGARFVRVDDQPTWIYRLHDGSKSLLPWTTEQERRLHA